MNEVPVLCYPIVISYSIQHALVVTIRQQITRTSITNHRNRNRNCYRHKILTMPYCHAPAIKCRVVPRVEGAIADTSRGQVGTIVTYTCEGGLRFPHGTDSAQTQCTGRGVWYPELDACRGALHMTMTQR